MNADAIARSYEGLERLCFGRALERRRFAFLEQVKDSHHALLCGEGDGRFLGRLLRANPCVEVDFVDASPRMTLLAQRRTEGMGRSAAQRVRFHLKDIRDFVQRCANYDLIATHFFRRPQATSADFGRPASSADCTSHSRSRPICK